MTYGTHKWRRRESNPRLDPQTGKPLSFMELPVAEALHVWQASIESASRHGDLAAWVVSGHFSSLLCTIGHHGHDPVAREWLKQTASKRSQWFATWHARNVELHTAEVAGEALKWLQLFDILSLWPCAQYPVTGEVIRKQPEPLNIDNWMLVREIHPHFELTDNKRPRIVFSPWPFEEPEIAIIAAAHLVPVRKYASAAELLAARVPLVAEWKLAAE